mmetsp:Transcript_256/g.589  ORF Transcript_256/g.589 Transcript_256/m.589 type:complete len:250 (-) Transcript_256:12-761(-)
MQSTCPKHDFKPGQLLTSANSPMNPVPPTEASLVTFRVRILSPTPHFVSHCAQSLHGPTRASRPAGAMQGAASDNTSSQTKPPSVGESAMARCRYFCVTVSLHFVQFDQSPSEQLTGLPPLSQTALHSCVSKVVPAHGVPHSLLRTLMLLWRSHRPVQSPPLHSAQSPNSQFRGTQSPQAGLFGHSRQATSRPLQELDVATGNAAPFGKASANEKPHFAESIAAGIRLRSEQRSNTLASNQRCSRIEVA